LLTGYIVYAMSKRYPLLWPLPLVLILLIFVFSSSRENKQGIYSSQIISGSSINEIVSEVGEKTDSIVEQVKLDNTELVIAFDEDRPYIHFMSIMNADGEYCLNGNTRVEIIEGGISGEYKVDEGHVLHYYVGEGSSETYENSKVLPENMVLCYSILTVGAGEIPPIAMSLCNGV